MLLHESASVAGETVGVPAGCCARIGGPDRGAARRDGGRWRAGSEAGSEADWSEKSFTASSINFVTYVHSFGSVNYV